MLADLGLFSVPPLVLLVVTLLEGMSEALGPMGLVALAPIGKFTVGRIQREGLGGPLSGKSCM